MTNHDLTDTTDFDDWAEVRELLTPDASAHDDQGDVDLLRIGGHLIVVAGPPGRWRARHRRQVHRLGFRPMPPKPAARLAKWRWSVPAPSLDDELRRVSAPHDVLPARGSLLAWARTWPAADELVRTQAVTVLREVFRVDPARLQLVAPTRQTSGTTKKTTRSGTRLHRRARGACAGALARREQEPAGRRPVPHARWTCTVGRACPRGWRRDKIAP